MGKVIRSITRALGLSAPKQTINLPNVDKDQATPSLRREATPDVRIGDDAVVDLLRKRRKKAQAGEGSIDTGMFLGNLGTDSGDLL